MNAQRLRWNCLYLFSLCILAEYRFILDNAEKSYHFITEFHLNFLLKLVYNFKNTYTYTLKYKTIYKILTVKNKL